MSAIRLTPEQITELYRHALNGPRSDVTVNPPDTIMGVGEVSAVREEDNKGISISPDGEVSIYTG